jgi:hypothetical protein
VNAEMEPHVLWMVQMMLSPDTKDNRLAFVNRCQELSERYGHPTFVEALDEADRRAREIAGPVEQEAAS